MGQSPITHGTKRESEGNKRESEADARCSQQGQDLGVGAPGKRLVYREQNGLTGARSPGSH